MITRRRFIQAASGLLVAAPLAKVEALSPAIISPGVLMPVKTVKTGVTIWRADKIDGEWVWVNDDKYYQFKIPHEELGKHFSKKLRMGITRENRLFAVSENFQQVQVIKA